MPRKSLKYVPHECGVSKCSARKATQLLKLRPYNITVIYAFKLRDPARRVHFCNCFLQSIIEGQIDPQLTKAPVIYELLTTSIRTSPTNRLIDSSAKFMPRSQR
jgi:hypothetical protein